MFGRRLAWLCADIDLKLQVLMGGGRPLMALRCSTRFRLWSTRPPTSCREGNLHPCATHTAKLSSNFTCPCVGLTWYTAFRTHTQVPILIGSTREDLGGVGGAAVPPAPPDAPPAPPACDPTRCSEDDFRDWGRSLGFDQKTLDKFVHAYNDDESGHPVLPLGATQWYVI